jgi:hypothetical protein
MLIDVRSVSRSRTNPQFNAIAWEVRPLCPSPDVHPLARTGIALCSLVRQSPRWSGLGHNFPSEPSPATDAMDLKAEIALIIQNRRGGWIAEVAVQLVKALTQRLLTE